MSASFKQSSVLFPSLNTFFTNSSENLPLNSSPNDSGRERLLKILTICSVLYFMNSRKSLGVKVLTFAVANIFLDIAIQNLLWEEPCPLLLGILIDAVLGSVLSLLISQAIGSPSSHRKSYSSPWHLRGLSFLDKLLELIICFGINFSIYFKLRMRRGHLLLQSHECLCSVKLEIEL